MTRRSKSHRRKRVSRKRVSRKRVSRKRVGRKMKRKRHISYSVNTADKDLQNDINYLASTSLVAKAKLRLAEANLAEARLETQKAIQELNDFYRENQESCFQAILRELKRKQV